MCSSQGKKKSQGTFRQIIYTAPSDPVLLFGLLKFVFDSFVTPWAAARQAPLSMGFSRQEYWSGLPFPSSGHLPHPEMEPASPALAGGFSTIEPPGKPRSDTI